MILLFSYILTANFVIAKNEIRTQGQYCNVASYVKVITAEIINFPPVTNTLNTFLNTTVLTHVPVDVYEMQLVGTSGYVSHFAQNLNIPFIPGNHFHILANIKINTPANESYALRMTLSNPVEQVLCYQINFGIWNL